MREILVPHDGSVLSGAVVESLAPLLSSEIHVTLLHVDDGQAFDEDVLSTAQQRIEAHGASVTRREAKASDPAGAILDVVDELRPELVAMSTHGRTGLDRLVRGSVAARVLRCCPSPLFMLNPHTHTAAGITSILAPLDGSDCAAEIVGPLLPFASALGARVTLFWVDWDFPTDTPSQAARRRAERAEEIARSVAGPRAQLEAAGLAVDLQIAYGDAAKEILDAAQPDAHQLLAMSTHGRSGPGRWLLGSIAEKVLSACRIPVLVHRPAKPG